MLDKIKSVVEEITSLKINNHQELESFRLKYLSKKGLISTLLKISGTYLLHPKKKRVKCLTSLKY
jgi:hypothetical protein